MINGAAEIARLTAAAAKASTPQQRASLARDLASLSGKLQMQTNDQIAKARIKKAEALDLRGDERRADSMGDGETCLCISCGRNHDHWQGCDGHLLRVTTEDSHSASCSNELVADPFKDVLDPF